MRAKRISIPRGSLSPFTSSAILQLMQEFNRKEDVKQCLQLAQLFKERAAKLKKEPCRQPSKAKKRTEADKLKRAEAFAKLKAGTYIPVAVAACLDETAAVRHEYQPSTPEVESGYDIAWRRQEAAQRAQEGLGNARIDPQPAQPQSVRSPAPQRPPQKDEPGYVTWLLTEIDRRKRAGTWTGK